MLICEVNWLRPIDGAVKSFRAALETQVRVRMSVEIELNTVFGRARRFGGD